MAINGFGAEKRGAQGREVPPITLPTFNLPDLDTEAEAKEAAERAAITRTIRQGREEQ